MQEINQNLLIDKKQNKKIGAKILLIALAVIGVMFIVINFVPVKYTLDVNQDNIQSITVYQNGAASSQLWSDTDETRFNKLVNKFNSTFSKDNLAYALFSGKLFEKEEITYEYTSSVVSKYATKTNSESKYILFSYAEDQQIMLNGKEYTSKELNSASKKYTKVLIEVQNTNTLTRTTLYYINASGNSYYQVTVNSTGAEMYDYISTLFE